jgi:hypothetical protein
VLFAPTASVRCSTTAKENGPVSLAHDEAALV